MIKKILIIFFLIHFPIVAMASFSADKTGDRISFKTKTWVGEIDPNTLVINGGKDNNELIQLADSPMVLGKIENLNFSDDRVSWYYPLHDLKVTSYIQNNHLIMRFETNKEQDIIFPRTGQNKEMQALIYPEGEGLFIPQTDPFWEKQLVGTSRNTQGELSMPFWGYYGQSNTATYILHQDLNNQLYFLKEKQLYTELHHHFKRTNKHIATFEISIILSEKTPIAPALEYKKFLKERNALKTLNEKARANKQIEKLYGAMHVYLWGSGRSLAALDKLQGLGLKNLWLGYDQDPRTHTHLVTSQIIEKAVNLGYLIGPYDSFHTMEDPKKSESINGIFEGLYPSGCIVDEDGKKNMGFGGKGCHMSSEALALEQPQNKTIYNRVDNFIKTGINSYFLDCDATGELFDDYSPTHPMTKEKDRENRIERMKYIANQKHMVLGSETAAAWSVPIIVFAHGNFSVFNAIHWNFTKSKEYGKWWPQEKPGFFFKSVKASEDYMKAKYDPQYRLPLFQTVFHESIITTDRWEISHLKIANAVKVRELLELFYGVPSIWSLDLEEIEKQGPHLQKLYQFFSPLHKIIATEELRSFTWATDNRQVQQIVFGDQVILTANFSEFPYHAIPPKSIEVLWIKQNKKEYFTP